MNGNYRSRESVATKMIEERSVEEIRQEIRYASRLAARTARLYRHIQTTGTFMSVLGGGSMVASSAAGLPLSVTYAFSIVFTVFGAILIAVRPADKAAQSEVDARRYQSLMADSHRMDAACLHAALDKARIPACLEVESLRNVVYNDVLLETTNRTDMLIPLSPREKIISLLA